LKYPVEQLSQTVAFVHLSQLGAQDVQLSVSFETKNLGTQILQGPSGSQFLQFLSLQVKHLSAELHDAHLEPQGSQVPLFAK